jgi:uncharacterized protein
MSEPPRIDFPCDYPIHVIGERHDRFRAEVLEIVSDHAPDFDEGAVTVRDSRAGSYCSVRVIIVATGSAQLEALHAALRRNPAVRMVL